MQLFITIIVCLIIGFGLLAGIAGFIIYRKRMIIKNLSNGATGANEIAPKPAKTPAKLTKPKPEDKKEFNLIRGEQFHLHLFGEFNQNK